MREWISVKDKIPTLNELVLCCGKKGGMCLGYAWSTRIWDGSLCVAVPNASGGRNITHWMPIPKPPEVE